MQFHAGPANNSLRTPQLPRDHRAGAFPLPGDSDADLAVLKDGGDYMASIHGHIQVLFQECGEELGRRLYYPGKHTFVKLAKTRIDLGLLEYLGKTGSPEGRGA